MNSSEQRKQRRRGISPIGLTMPDSSIPSLPIQQQQQAVVSPSGTNPVQFAPHYALLRQYLELFLVNLTERGKHISQDKTGKKLAQFRLDQFWQFSQDVFDEINRRLDPDQKVPFLVIRLEFPAKRNQARQKLATLQTYRFQKLAVQVMLDIERRYPFIKYDYEMELEREAAWRQSNRDSTSIGPPQMESHGMIVGDIPPSVSHEQTHNPQDAFYQDQQQPSLSNWRQKNRQPPPPPLNHHVSPNQKSKTGIGSATSPVDNEDAESDYKYTPATQFVPPLSPPSVPIGPPLTAKSDIIAGTSNNRKQVEVQNRNVSNAPQSASKRADMVPFRPRQHPPSTKLFNQAPRPLSSVTADSHHQPHMLTSGMIPDLSEGTGSSSGSREQLHVATSTAPSSGLSGNTQQKGHQNEAQPISPTGSTSTSLGSKLVGWFKKKSSSPSNVSPSSQQQQTGTGASQYSPEQPAKNNLSGSKRNISVQDQQAGNERRRIPIAPEVVISTRSAKADRLSRHSTLDGDPETRIRRLKSKLRLKDGEYMDLQERFANVQSSYEGLLNILKEKEQFNNDVKKEANNLLQEIKNLALKNKMLMEERDRLLAVLAKSPASSTTSVAPASNVSPLQLAANMVPSVVSPASEIQSVNNTNIVENTTSEANLVLQRDESFVASSTKFDSSPSFPFDSNVNSVPVNVNASQSVIVTKDTPIPSSKAFSTISSPDPTSYLDSLREALAKLHIASTNVKRTSVLQPMRQILLVCKSLTQDAETLELTVLEDEKRIGFAVERLTEQSIALMNATRDHATGENDSKTADRIERLGSALLEGADELVNVMKSCMDRQDESEFVPTPQPGSAREQHRQHEPHQVSLSPIVSPSSQSSSSDMNRSHQATNLQQQKQLLPEPRDENENIDLQNSHDSEEMLVEEMLSLKAFTEDSSDLIAEQIQELLLAMRNKSNDGIEIQRQLNQLVSHVESLVFELIRYPQTFWNDVLDRDDTSSSVNGTRPLSMNDILETLTTTKDDLAYLSTQIAVNMSNRSLKQKIAHGSFELAKQCKELLLILDQSRFISSN